jgi:hypothetical protein
MKAELERRSRYIMERPVATVGAGHARFFSHAVEIPLPGVLFQHLKHLVR